MRWLIEPLSVASPTSSEGGASSRIAARRGWTSRSPLAKRSSSETEFAPHALVRDDVGGARVLRQVGREAAAGVEIGEDQDRDDIAVRAGDHDVAHIGRAMRDEGDAQRPDADPGAGRELEVLGDAALEQQALFGVGRIVEPQRVAEPVEALLVERLRGQLRLAPVARRDVRAAAAAPRICRRAARASRRGRAAAGRYWWRSARPTCGRRRRARSRSSRGR